ncbi:MAG TPA: sulfotransferase [Rhizomicrobium sp.]|nr:sulfotransferase [Rhizomicrobium sp.]
MISSLHRGDTAKAVALACAALERGEIHSLLLNLRASRLEQEGNDRAALSDLRRAHELDPADPSVSNALGLILAKHDRHLEAMRAYDAALAVAPRFAPAHFNKGIAAEAIGYLDAARQCYEAAIAADSGVAEPFVQLAGLAVRRGDMEEAVRKAGEVLARRPDHPAALRVFIAANIEQGRFQEAEALIEALLRRDDLPDDERYLAMGLLGELRERQLRFPDAYAAFVDGNSAYYRANRPKFGSNGTALSAIGWLTHYYREKPRVPPRAPEQHRSGAAGHVFLLGFPRSGTTLLEQALASHPAVITMEEKEALSASVRAFMADPQGHAKLFALSDAALEEHRMAYWRSVAEYGCAVEGKVFVDKLPFHTLKLPLIAMLFPSAKILFALRDPRDVVLGCLRARFRVNAYMIELLRPMDAAAFYSAYMNLADLYRKALPFSMYEVRHENLVSDFDTVCRHVCAFIGIDWSESMRAFASRQQVRAVATPSGKQLARGLSPEGIGRWQKYADQLAPLLPVLAPWVDRFGYDR